MMMMMMELEEFILNLPFSYVCWDCKIGAVFAEFGVEVAMTKGQHFESVPSVMSCPGLSVYIGAW